MRRRPVFHPLPVAAVDRLTDDAVAVTFAVPPELRETFAFRAGQHLTVRRVDRRPARTSAGRTRSARPRPSWPRRGRAADRGAGDRRAARSPSYAATALRAGDAVEVLPPLGHFTTGVRRRTAARHYAAIAAGSGITPVLSLVATALAVEPASRFTLVYGNRHAPQRHVRRGAGRPQGPLPGPAAPGARALPRAAASPTLLSGRLDADRLRAAARHGSSTGDAVDEWFLCGPYGMVLDARAVLAERGVPDSAVHTELFHVDERAGAAAPAADRAGRRRRRR